jgi:hypothetical protein
MSSFDSLEVTTFDKDLAREDDLGSVIRAHIHIESELNTIVETLAPGKEHLRRLGLDFDQTVTLALVLGFDPTWAPALRALGNLRNKFAHQLHTCLDAPVVNSLYESLSPEGKSCVQATFAALKKDNELLKPASRFVDLDSKGRFQLIAIAIRSGLHAWQIRRQVHNGA